MAEPLSRFHRLEELCRDQRNRWSRGERALVESYFAREPVLSTDDNLLLDFVYAEYCLREELGDCPTPEEYLTRFPKMAERLRPLLEVHDAVSATRTLVRDQTLLGAAEEGAGRDVPEERLLQPAGVGRNSPGPPAIPGFEVLEEISRGGMGIIYKARQLGLNRLVALKMILSGPYSTADEEARFRGEAEAAARLKHANIVQIFQIGEHAGYPYFALEFVDGGNLAKRLAGAPLPALQAAAICTTLARAVSYAHEQGVLHRDLKPANVLLEPANGVHGSAVDATVADRELSAAGPGPARRGPLSWRKPRASGPAAHGESGPVEFVPKITDWGLAKLLDVEQGRTQSGAIMGTPSYMAPEQAAGLVHTVGKAADIYSLGAILYEMLTGRPPFRAATVWETLQQLQTEEPVAPGQLQPGLPRDLETICLKCIEKKPTRRYLTAADLAEDLRRFRAGEPITARPVNAAERSWRWMGRNRLAASLLAAVAVVLVGGFIVSTVFAIQAKKATTQAEIKADEANKNARETRQAVQETYRAVDRYFTLVSENRLLDVPDATPLRRELLSAALEYYQKLPKSESEDAEIQAELAAAYLRMSQIEHITGSGEIARLAKGMDIIERLLDAKTPIATFKSLDNGIVDVVGGRGMGMFDQELPESIKVFQRGVDVWERLLSMNPRSKGFRNDLAGFCLGLTLLKVREPSFGKLPPAVGAKQAEPLFLRALALWKSLASDYPDNLRYCDAMTTTERNLAGLYSYANDDQAAIARLKDAEAIARKMTKDFPRNATFWEQLAAIYFTMRYSYRKIDNIQATVEAVRNEFSIREKLVADYPSNAAYRSNLNKAYTDGQEFAVEWSPQFASRPGDFLKVFDLYAETRDRQLANLPAAARAPHLGAGPQQSPTNVAFPTGSPHLEGTATAALRGLFEVTPDDKRGELLKTVALRAANRTAPGRETYRLAEIALRWWAGERNNAIKLLEADLREKPNDPEWRLALFRARAALGQTSPSEEQNAELLDTLFKTLEKPAIDGQSTRRAIASIRRLDPRGTLSAGRWERLMDRPDAPVRWLTGGALPLDPAVLKSFVPALELCLSDPDTAVRLAAAQRLWDLNHKSEQVVPVLMGCVRDAAGDLQHRAFAILSAIGPEAKEALAAIKPLLGDSSDEIRIAAAQALWKIGRDTTGIKRLAAEFQKRVGSTDSSDVAFVGAAMSVLEDLDSGGQDTVPSLIEAAAATPAGDARRGQLINVVRRIDPNGKAAFPKLLELSKAESADRRVLAFAAASAYGLATEDLIALAKKCLDDPDRGVQTAAATAVCLFSDDPKAAKVFIDCLKNSNGLINWGVVQHLSANRAVLPDLVPVLAERLPKLRGWDVHVAAHALNSYAWQLAIDPDLSQRDPQRIVEWATFAADRQPQITEIWNTLGVANYRSGDFKSALTALGRSMDLSDGGDSRTWFFLAMCYGRLGDQDRALKWFKAAEFGRANYQPKNEELLRFRGKAAQDLGLSPEGPWTKTDAFAIADAYFASSPTPAAYFWRGRAYAELGDWDRAAQDFGKATTLGVKTFFPWYMQALVCVAKGDKPAYQATCAGMLRRFHNNENWGIDSDLAWTCTLAPDAMVDFAPALALAQVPAHGMPRNALFAQTWGAVLYRAGRFEEAIHALKDAQAIEHAKSNVPYAGFFIAMAHHRLGHASEARTCLKKACDDAEKALKHPDSDIDGSKLPWNRRLTFELLRKEAEALIADTAGPKPQAAASGKN